MKRVFTTVSILVLWGLISSACGPSPAALPGAPSAVPTSTSSPLPSATPLPTFTSTPVPTATPVPHPLEIRAMRAREYPGSDIVIESMLDPGVNYNRYYVSYAYVDLIARSGYIVFRSDYRGHASSEGEARGAYSNPDYTVDVLNAVASMKRHPDADPDRMGMWGHSMGGYITLRSMVINDDIKAGVIWAGVVASYPDLLSRWRRGTGASSTPTPSPRSWRLSLIQQYGSPEENPEFWNSISANSYLSDLSGPIQLHHGTADADVPLEFSELLFYQMMEAHQYVELYKYEGDNHNISNSFGIAMQRTIEFFDRYVKEQQSPPST